MKGLINSPFQPVQCGRKSKKINNKEPDYILQLSDSSEKHIVSGSQLFLPLPTLHLISITMSLYKTLPFRNMTGEHCKLFDHWSNLDLVS